MRRLQNGFTMIELLVAMSVFSFLLLIIVVGFMNIVRLHNQALASERGAGQCADGDGRAWCGAVRDSAGGSVPSVPTGIRLARCVWRWRTEINRYYYVNPLGQGDVV